MTQQETEIQLWSKALNNLQQENIQMKNRLADLIKGIEDDHTLDEAESFLNRFISKDAVFALMRHDIAAHLKNLEECTASGLLLSRKHEVLQSDLLKIENELNKLKLEFEEYISSKLV